MSSLEIKPEEFEIWSNSGKEKQGLPWLLKRLLQASSPYDVLEYDIQTGNNTFVRGFDGYTVSTREVRKIPKGKTIWEFGTQKQALNKKMRNDCAKRLIALRKQAREYNFRFVTTRNWPSGKEEAEKLNKNNRWQSTDCYTREDIVDWMNEIPWVCQTFREEFDFPFSDNIISAYSLYKNYRHKNGVWGKTDKLVPDEFIISNRHKYSEYIANWILDDKPGFKYIKILFEDFEEAKYFVIVSIAYVLATQNIDFFDSPISDKVLWFEEDINKINPSRFGTQHTLIVPSTHIAQAVRLSQETETKIIIVLSKQNGDSNDSHQKLPSLWKDTETKKDDPEIPMFDSDLSINCLLKHELILEEDIKK